MKFPRPYTLKEVAQLIDAEFFGPENFEILGMNEIHVVEKGDIVFVDHQKYYQKAFKSRASFVIINGRFVIISGRLGEMVMSSS